MQKGFGNVDKNDPLSTVRSNQVFDNTNNKNNITSEQNVKSKYFIFPSQEALFEQGINDTRKTDGVMISGEWSVEQSRAIASGLVSLVREEEKPKMASINEWTIPGSNENEILIRLYDPGTSQKPSPALIFVHGGGWTVGSVDKIKALALAKDCYAMKLELLTNARVVDDAIRFVAAHTVQKEKANSDKIDTNVKDNDHEEQHAIGTANTVF